MCKKIILILLAIIGIIAPCTVAVNFNRGCEEQRVAVVEFIGIEEEELVAQEICEARSRVLACAEKAKKGMKQLVVRAMCGVHRWFDEEKPTANRHTYLFYARQAGGIPCERLSV